jgi:hypothetical protein
MARAPVRGSLRNRMQATRAGRGWRRDAARAGRRRDPQQQAQRRTGRVDAAAARADRVVAARLVEAALEGVLRAHLDFQRRVGAVVDQEDRALGAEGPAGRRVGGAVFVLADQGQALVRVDRADRLPDRAVARDADRVLHFLAGRRQVHGVAEAHLDLAGRQVLGADHVVAHVVAVQQVAEILLVQRRQALGQVAHARAAREVAVVVDFFLRQGQRDVREAAGGGASALFARRALQQVAQQRTAREQGQPGRLPDRLGAEHVVDPGKGFVLYVDRHDTFSFNVGRVLRSRWRRTQLAGGR